MIKRLELKIFGRVQGVFFRDSSCNVAQKLGLVGFVRNEPDGSVYILAEGPEEKLIEFLNWCHKGPPLARVDKIETKWAKSKGEFSDFVVLR